ncbi:MAG: ATP phosphoribosyltransferase [Myxococcales bacterium]|nr:ATP phosphoribosyltransferase [Myxococcales bacterium]
MLGGEQLRIAVPSKGRLRDSAIEILRGAGLHFRLSGRRLFSICTETETRIIFSNVQDIPVLVAEGVVDLGITGSDQVLEKRVEVIEHCKLGFGQCRVSVAAHKDSEIRKASDLSGKVVGSSFPNLAADYFRGEGAEDVHILAIEGAVEVMVLLGLVDAIVEIVETGNSLLENDLVELWPVLSAEAVLIGNRNPREPEERDLLLRRIDGVLAARRYSLLEYNCPADKLEAATQVTPGFSSPTVQSLVDKDWYAVRVLVERAHVHRILDKLSAIGCVAILESDIRHTRL